MTKTFVSQIFCESESCRVREATVVTNEDKPEPKKDWWCPSCGGRAKMLRKLPIAVYVREQLDSAARARRLRYWR
jgi:hypothetical protein